MHTYFLIDRQEIDVGFLHWQEKDKSIASVPDTSSSATSMHKRTVGGKHSHLGEIFLKYGKF